ncbi:MAG: hypothetical protein IT368_16945 [Candidatus Hydrogenedentes bacterium]|nr:hypothetical protein [Candidatus Hydrogenedentota bacterium]
MNTAQIVLYWNETSGVSVESIDILTGFNGSLYSVHGENGTLRITDTAGNTYEAGLTFPTVIPVCGGDDPLAELPPAEVVTENWAVVTMPIDGVVTNLEYAEPGGSYVPLGLPTSTIPKQGNCTPFETNGYPIPITKQLIHGDPNLRDDRAYVIALVGDAFTLAQLGDPFLSESDVPVDGFPNNRIELSKASADTARFLLQHEPFREYAGKIKIYRIDFISNSGTISTAQVPQDTAFKLQRSASGSIYATNASLISVALARTGLAVNNIGMLANTDKGYGSGSPPIATYINTENSRRAVALHEFGHSIVWLQDEYECRQGNCSIPASGASVARINTVIRGSGIPSRAEVPWAHWLGRREDGTVVAECANHALGEPYAACQANWDCQCQSYSPGNCLHLPTCETGGDVDISGRHYGHGGKWLIPLSSTDAISWPPPPSATLVVEPWPEPSDIGAVVGLYEGGAYKPERAYRPMLRCRMRSDDDVAYVVAKVISDTPNPYVEQQVAYIGVRTMEFCPVCREALTAKILEAAGVALGFSPAQEEIVPVSGLDSVFSVQLPGFPTQGHSVSVISWRKNDVVIPGSQGLTQLAIPGDTLAADDVIGVTLVDNTGWILPDNPQQPGYDTVQEQLQWRVRVGAP